MNYRARMIKRNREGRAPSRDDMDHLALYVGGQIPEQVFARIKNPYRRMKYLRAFEEAVRRRNQTRNVSPDGQ